MQKQKIAAAALILYLCVAGVWSAKFLLSRGASGGLGVRLAGRSKGVPDAPLKITEFFDYECHACRTSYQTLNEYFQKYPGQIYLEGRFNPLPAHPHGFLSALYAYCANEQKHFWPMHDLLFDHQDDWAGAQNADEKFREYAKTAGLNPGKLDACLKNPASGTACMA